MVAWSVECPDVDFSLGHNRRVLGWTPTPGSTFRGESAWDSPSSFAPSPTHIRACSLQNSLLKNADFDMSILLLLILICC